MSVSRRPRTVALAYLQGRGLAHPDMLAHFRLGFANRTLGYRLPEKNRNAGAEIRGRMQKLGVIRDSGHEHFNGSVVVPIIDPQGTVLGMYGRKITAMAAAAMTITVPGKPERMAVRTFGSPPKVRSQNCAVAYTSVATK